MSTICRGVGVGVELELAESILSSQSARESAKEHQREREPERAREREPEIATEHLCDSL